MENSKDLGVRPLKQKEEYREIPKQQRYVSRPPLTEIFGLWKSKANRNQASNFSLPLDGGGLGWGCLWNEQNNRIGESPQEKTYRCGTTAMVLFKNETNGRVEIQEATAHR